ncbi:uncharacterized protein LOC121888015 isoform X2 [Thunnus maccoyii]|uniref:uncharacterized protein LOC121888015 isoform X2 n=1 Tax=Thunnus maccoyii TaxID=8240 RepID=UPI001C4A8DFF|nr:uncharacterized protein LOC121888015 isoform X2 [Thunnus maccoyii]
MFSAFVYTFMALNSFCHRSSAAGHGDPSWFMGCVNASNRLYPHEDVRDLDPVTCSVRCLDEGYQTAALTLERCYCGNQLHGWIVSECFNISSHGGSKDIRGESEGRSVLYLPVGGGKGNVALYRTEGPFLHSISVSTSPDRVHAGKTFVLEVSGNLAGRPNQPTGIVGLGEESLCHVNVEFLWTTTAGQSSHHVSVLDDGSFAVSSDWILETSGKHEINISVSNPLSRLSSTLQLSVLQPFPDTLVISLLHGPLGVPSCIPFLQMNSHNVTVKAAYVGDPVTLQAYVADGMEAEFSWWFTHREKEENKGVEEERTSVKTACLPNTDCLNSTMN